MSDISTARPWRCDRRVVLADFRGKRRAARAFDASATTIGREKYRLWKCENEPARSARSARFERQP